MKELKHLLLTINDRLDLPQPVKSQVMLEISADMTDLYETLIQRGFSQSQAIAEVQEKFNISNEELGSLSRIHKSGLQKWVEKISAKKRSQWEIIIMSMMMLFFTATIIRLAVDSAFFFDASFFVLPVSALLGFSIIIFGYKFYRLYILKNHNIKVLRDHVSCLKYAVAFTLFFGIAGYIFEMFMVESPSIFFGPFLFVTLMDFSADIQLVINTMLKTSALMIFSLFTAMLISLEWYIVERKISKIEYAEYELIIQE